jgi:hypothetical protein
VLLGRTARGLVHRLAAARLRGFELARVGAFGFDLCVAGAFAFAFAFAWAFGLALALAFAFGFPFAFGLPFAFGFGRDFGALLTALPPGTGAATVTDPG